MQASTKLPAIDLCLQLHTIITITPQTHKKQASTARTHSTPTTTLILGFQELVFVYMFVLAFAILRNNINLSVLLYNIAGFQYSL